MLPKALRVSQPFFHIAYVFVIGQRFLQTWLHLSCFGEEEGENEKISPRCSAISSQCIAIMYLVQHRSMCCHLTSVLVTSTREPTSPRSSEIEGIFLASNRLLAFGHDVRALRYSGNICVQFFKGKPRSLLSSSPCMHHPNLWLWNKQRHSSLFPSSTARIFTWIYGRNEAILWWDYGTFVKSLGMVRRGCECILKHYLWLEVVAASLQILQFTIFWLPLCCFALVVSI